MNKLVHPPAIVENLPGGVKAYQGKYGWYSVSYEEYLAMKENHKQLLSSYLALLQFWRLVRKTTKPVSELALNKAADNLGTKLHTYCAVEAPENCRDATRQTLAVMRQVYLSYLSEYSRVRRPVADKSQVSPVQLIANGCLVEVEPDGTKKFKMSKSQYLFMNDLLGQAKVVKDVS